MNTLILLFCTYFAHQKIGLGVLGSWTKKAYADDVNLIGDHTTTIERNADVLLNVCKDIGLAVNTRKTKYMEVGFHRGMIANAHIKIGNNSYEKVETFNYLRSSSTN